MENENSPIEVQHTSSEAPVTHPVEGSSSATEKMDVKRGRIGEFKLYEVAEHELILLEKGSDASLWLNFAIAAISIFFSVLAALVTLDSSSAPKAFIVFVVITICSFITSVICFVFWYRNKGTGDDILKTIRGRIKE